MKNKKNLKILFFLTPIILLIMTLSYGVRGMPETIYIQKGVEKESLVGIPFIFKDSKSVTAINLLSPLTQKTIKVKEIDDIYVIPGGQPIGVKINTDGLLVVAFSDFKTENNESASPAAFAGVEIGDYIKKINGKEINTAEDLVLKLNGCEGKEISLTIKRLGKEQVIKLMPLKSMKDNRYKIGIWVRDYISGIGTMTYYDPNTKRFAALGHPILDVDTKDIIEIRDGLINKAQIASIVKGSKGNPGELRGIFLKEENPLGKIESNTNCGIFGILKREEELYTNNKIKVGLRNEITIGEAKILTTIEGEKPKLYNIRIDKLFTQSEPGPKSMVIRITDEELLKKTGGILQGMSGSPIIQKGKIVGAVTHVLVNKPDTGYGVYIEWMLQSTNSLK